jgi:hypothetical protein
MQRWSCAILWLAPDIQEHEPFISPFLTIPARVADQFTLDNSADALSV